METPRHVDIGEMQGWNGMDFRESSKEKKKRRWWKEGWRGMMKKRKKKKEKDWLPHLCVRAFMILAFCSGPARSGVVKLFCL